MKCISQSEFQVKMQGLNNSQIVAIEDGDYVEAENLANQMRDLYKENPTFIFIDENS